jgi:hypothetical protein
MALQIVTLSRKLNPLPQLRKEVLAMLFERSEDKGLINQTTCVVVSTVLTVLSSMSPFFEPSHSTNFVKSLLLACDYTHGQSLCGTLGRMTSSCYSLW